MLLLVPPSYHEHCTISKKDVIRVSTIPSLMNKVLPRYTDIRVNPCDVIKKSSLSGEKLMYKYFRKDGETTPAWAKSAKKKGIDKKKENKSRRKSEENSKMSKTSKGGGDDEGDDKEGISDSSIINRGCDMFFCSFSVIVVF